MESSFEDIPPLPHATTASVTGFEVASYSCSGDPAFLDNHIFTIRIWISQDNYAIRRSYSNICMLDNLLRRKYARTQVPPLPLSGAGLFVKANRRMSSLAIPAAQSSSVTGKSFTGLTDHSKRRTEVKRVDASEPIAQKKGALTEYLKNLIAIPVLALSREITDFFDEESPDGLEFERSELSEIDMLLQGEDATRVKVKSSLNVPLTISPGSVIIWKFSTEHKDIGFSVEFSDQVVSPYQRCNSHLQSVSGIFEAPAAGTVALIWV